MKKWELTDCVSDNLKCHVHPQPTEPMHYLRKNSTQLALFSHLFHGQFLNYEESRHPERERWDFLISHGSTVRGELKKGDESSNWERRNFESGFSNSTHNMTYYFEGYHSSLKFWQRFWSPSVSGATQGKFDTVTSPATWFGPGTCLNNEWRGVQL